MRERLARFQATKKGRASLAVVAAIVVLLLPHGFNDHWRAVFVDALAFALLALGLNVVVGFAGLLDLGYVAFFAVGSYSYAILSGAARYSGLIEAQNLKAPALAQRIKPEWHDYLWGMVFVEVIVAAVAVVGVPPVRMKLWAFAIGAVVASFGGVVYASKFIFIDPNSFQLFGSTFASVTILAMVVVGGMGGIAGPILGAGVLVFVPELSR